MIYWGERGKLIGEQLLRSVFAECTSENPFSVEINYEQETIFNGKQLKDRCRFGEGYDRFSLVLQRR